MIFNGELKDFVFVVEIFSLFLMSCSAGKGAFFKISRIFVKIKRWVLVLVLVVSMSLNCEFSSLNGRLPANFKLRKGKESLHGPNCVRKWTRKLLFLWLFCVVIGSIFWFFLSLNFGSLEGKVEITGFCQENAPIFRTYSNVTNNQLHSLASLFSKSDQVLYFWFLNIQLTFFFFFFFSGTSFSGIVEFICILCKMSYLLCLIEILWKRSGQIHWYFSNAKILHLLCHEKLSSGSKCFMK